MDTLRHFYGNRSVDIQGGEPTVHKDILPLITHCAAIGLYPVDYQRAAPGENR